MFPTLPATAIDAPSAGRMLSGWRRLSARFWVTTGLLAANWCWVRESGLNCIWGYELGLFPYFKFNTSFQSEIDWWALNATIVLTFVIVFGVKYWPVRKEIEDVLRSDRATD